MVNPKMALWDVYLVACRRAGSTAVVSCYTGAVSMPVKATHSGP